MSSINKDHLLSAGITDTIIARRISEALRYEHTNVVPAIAQIEKVTGIKAITARKWYNGKHVPRSRHLLMLAMYYPKVLQAICELLGIDAVWQEALGKGLIETMRANLNSKWENWKKNPRTGDKFVTIRVRVNLQDAMQLNQRQLWFLGQLQQGYKMHICNLSDTWHTHIRTAKRDIAGLLEAKLIVAMKTGRNCKYELFNTK